MDRTTESILILLEHPLARHVLGSAFDPKKEELHFERISYGVLSGGEKALVSWAWIIWMGTQPPARDQERLWKEWPGYPMRDAFEGFGTLDDDVTSVVLRAFFHRYRLDGAILNRRTTSGGLHDGANAR